MKNYELEISNNKLILSALKEEILKNQRALERAYQEDEKYISNMTKEQEEELLEEIFCSYIDIQDKREKIANNDLYLKKFYKHENELKHNINLSLYDIIDNTQTHFLSAILLENILILTISSNFPINILTTAINTLAITFFTYLISLKYFTSNYYKNKLKQELTNLQIVTEMTEIANKERRLELSYLTQELQLQLIKLLELSDNKQDIREKNIYLDINTSEESIKRLIKGRKE